MQRIRIAIASDYRDAAPNVTRTAPLLLNVTRSGCVTKPMSRSVCTVQLGVSTDVTRVSAPFVSGRRLGAPAMDPPGGAQNRHGVGGRALTQPRISTLPL